jgi:hypothetical protein
MAGRPDAARGFRRGPAREGRRPKEIQAWLGHHAASFTLHTHVGRARDLPDPDALGPDCLARPRR